MIVVNSKNLGDETIVGGERVQVQVGMSIVFVR
jgi:hypothetical protein